MKQIRRFGRMSVAVLLAALAPLTGCSDSQDDNDGKAGSSSKAGSDAAGGADSGATQGGASGHSSEPELSELFAVPSEVYTADFASSTSYVPIVPSLDVERIEIDDAREIDGRASIGQVGKYLFIASSTEPVVNRFEVQASGALEAAGSLNFSNYGVPEFFAIDAWGAVWVNEEKAYIFNGTDGSHVAWNPTTMEITGSIEGPGLVQEGYNLESVAVVRGNRMYRMFTFLNYDSWEFLAEPQYMAVYDLEKDELLDVVEENRCPQLYSRPFVDEQGDIYFSGWVWSPGFALVGDYPKSCALRIKDGEDSFDPDYQLNFAADVTDGREGAMLRYLGNGKALLDVYHDERTSIDANTDPQKLVEEPNWRLWQIDLETKEGGPVEGLDFKAGGYTDVGVGDRTFLMVPNDDYSETTGWEIVDGEAKPGFKIQGSSYAMVKLR